MPQLQGGTDVPLFADATGLYAYLPGTLATAVYTVATLPAYASVPLGSRAFVSDATTPAWNAAAVGAGAVKCGVITNATGWVFG